MAWNDRLVQCDLRSYCGVVGFVAVSLSVSHSFAVREVTWGLGWGHDMCGHVVMFLTCVIYKLCLTL